MAAANRSLLDDPIAFAEDLYGTMGVVDDPRVHTHAPREYAAFKAAYGALCVALGAESGSDAGLGCEHPAVLMDERAAAWAGKAFFDGVRFGIAADQLRRRCTMSRPAPSALVAAGSGAAAASGAGARALPRSSATPDLTAA